MFKFLDSCLYSNERNKESVNFDRQEGGKNLGGVRGGETIIRIYLFEYIEKPFSIKQI